MPFFRLFKENAVFDMVLVDEYVNREHAERKAKSHGAGYYRIEHRGSCVIEFWVKDDNGQKVIEYA